MVKALGFVSLFAVATGAFALTHGFDEYQIAQSAYTYRIVAGVEVELTQEELTSNCLIDDSRRALPIAAVAVVLLAFHCCSLAGHFTTFRLLSLTC